MFSSFVNTQREQSQHIHEMTILRTERDQLASDYKIYQSRVGQEMEGLRNHVKDVTTRYERMNEKHMKSEEIQAQQAFTIKTLQHAADTSHVYQQQVCLETSD